MIVSESEFENKVLDFGREVFKKIGQEQPSTFNRQGISGRLMEWSMKKPDLKVNMFRLVDVLPTLKTSKAVASHAREYLEDPSKEVSRLAPGLLKLGSGKFQAPLTAWAVRFGVHQMAKQFIAGESAKSAIKKLKRIRDQGMCFTVDLLGEFSVSETEAKHYVDRYMEALDELGKSTPSWQSCKAIIADHPGESSPICISVKLTALYSQCGPLNFKRSVEILSERLAIIARRAKELSALIYVDAEDSANNPIVYQVFKNVFSSPEFKSMHYPGIVVQAYAKEAKKTLLDLIEFAKMRAAPIAIRLVKGAYWDQETILSEQQDWPSPLFTHKESTDANYEELSKLLIDNHQNCLPAFGSHNVRSLAYACCYAKEKGLQTKDFELQMLYGMADPIARAFKNEGYLVRFYVPLGEILPGMGYLVRRLLENTSNESFLRHTFFDSAHVDTLLTKPNFRDNS